jgi:hypothetical protein
VSEAEDLAAKHLGLPPVGKLLDELAKLDEVARRRRVHEAIRLLAGASAEMQQAYRDAIISAKHIGRQDWKSALSEAKKAGTREQAPRPAGDEHPERLKVPVRGRNPFDVARDVADHLLKVNEPPHLFAMGPAAAVLLCDDGKLDALDQDGWLAYVAERVDFLSRTSDGEPIVAPPAAVMKIITAIILRELPQLDGVTSTPYLDADGNLIDRDGYHPGTRLVLRMDGLTLSPVSAAPTGKEVTAAVKLLTQDWLGDFPFASTADKANLIAELLTITGRELFPLAPMFVHDASTAGSGKGLLLHTISIIATGEPAEVMELPSDGDEQRKTVTSVLLAGKLLVVWDELHIIQGRTLAAILTAEIYSGRILGTNKLATVRNKLVQIALGNNVEVRGDMKRRVAPSRLTPADEHPEHRTDFRHPDLVGWVREHRGELLAAAFTIWRYWMAVRRPEADVTLGSFERWAHVVGGALQAACEAVGDGEADAAAGIQGFLTGTGEWLSYSEDHDDGWPSHLASLHRYFKDRWFTVSAVADAVNASYIKCPPLKRDPEKELASQLAYAYRGNREKWHRGLCLIRSTERDSEHGSYTWAVRQRDEPGNDAHAQNDAATAGGGSSPGCPASPESQVRDGKATGDSGDVPGHLQETAKHLQEVLPGKTAGQNTLTGDAGHPGDESSAPVTSNARACSATPMRWRSDGIPAIADSGEGPAA